MGSGYGNTIDGITQGRRENDVWFTVGAFGVLPDAGGVMCPRNAGGL